MKILSENPYRILGVYANAAKKDIVANKGKATAFLKVNRPVEFPLDLKGILPTLNRTLELMNEAESHLSIAKEQIKYAQFWFLKITQLDDIAFNHLLAGNTDGAKEIWSKQESVSSLQNKLVCFLIENKPEEAVNIAEKLYDKFGSSFISKVDAKSTLQMSATDLLHQFIDTLGEELGMQNLLNYELGAEVKAYISSQTVGPLINKISSEVDKAKKVDHNNPKARLEAARNLVRSTKEPFKLLKNILSASDSQYQMIADKLGLEILQCGIDYYNNSEDDDAPYTAMKIQKYAQSIVVGTLARQRCDENVKILQKNIDELPPKEVMAEDKAIKAELSKFVRLPDKILYAINLLHDTKPHLQSIKLKLGATNQYYLRVSTQVVNNALHNLVEEVNESQEPLVKLSKLLEDMDSNTRNAFLAFHRDFSEQIGEIQRNVKSTLREAWRAMRLIDEFDMEPSFITRYKENRSTLRSLCESMGVSTTPYVSRTSTTSRTASRSSTSASSTSSSSRPRPSAAYNSNSSSNSSSSFDGNGGCLVVFLIFLVIGIIAFVKSHESSSSYASVEPYYSEVDTFITDTAIVDEEIASAYSDDEEYYDTAMVEELPNEEEYYAENVNTYNEVQYSTGDRPYQSFYGRGEYDKRTDNSLTIRNEYSRDAVVFLETTSGRKIRHVYINAGNNFTMSNVPAGRYIVKIMQGTSWNPEKYNGDNAPKGGFMRELSMSESGASDIMDFPSVSSGQYGSYEITLYKVQNGNMHTHDIDNAVMFN